MWGGTQQAHSYSLESALCTPKKLYLFPFSISTSQRSTATLWLRLLDCLVRDLNHGPWPFTGCSLTTCQCLLFCVFMNLMAWLKNYKSCMWTHKLIPKINAAVGLPLAQLFSLHSLRMHKHCNALRYHSHTALRNWWYSLRDISQNSLLSLVKVREVTLYIYCNHCTTQ